MRQYETKTVQIERRQTVSCVCDWCKQPIPVDAYGYRQTDPDIELKCSETGTEDYPGWSEEYDLCQACWAKLPSVFGCKPRRVDR